MVAFTQLELDYLSSQRLGRLATVDARSAPQNSPVGFSVRDDGTVVIGGWNMGRSRKFRNLATNDRVSFVVDDIASVKPWKVRGVEIRGRADAVTGVESAGPMSGEEIRIHAERIISWGLDDPAAGPTSADAGATEGAGLGATISVGAVAPGHSIRSASMKGG